MPQIAWSLSDPADTLRGMQLGAPLQVAILGDATM